jgi:leader peptidase (prepilin peptidase)/N-methyltransferase
MCMSFGLLIPIVAVVGLVIGSFLTVVAVRVPEGGSAVAPPPFVLEFVTAGVFVLFAIKFGDNAALPAFCILAATLVVQSWIDLRTKRLPREITMWGGGLGGIALIVAAIVNDEPERIWMAALGAVIAVVFIGGIYQASKMYYGSAMGFGWGDVVLSPLLGMYLGWLSPGIVVPGLFFGFIIGAIVGVAAMALTRGDRQMTLPFGPSLAAGTVVAVFAGQPFVDSLLGR